MNRILYLLTGGATSDFIDRLIEKFDEPRLRRKATEQGFAALFEEHLIQNRYYGRSNASLRAFGEARGEFKRARNP
jgi:hypothetical protein